MSFASLLAGYANRTISSSSGNNGKNHTENEKEKPSQIIGPYYHRIQTVANESTHNLSTITTSEQISFGGLGILIIIVDSLPHEILWRLWLDHYTHHHHHHHHTPPTVPSSSSSSGLMHQQHPSTVHIWIHAKHPERITSPWIQQRLVTDFQLRPSWGSVELTEVMIHMLVNKSIFLSLSLLVSLYPVQMSSLLSFVMSITLSTVYFIRLKEWHVHLI